MGRLLVLTLGALALWLSAAAAPGGEVMVFAASSLSDAMEAAGRKYEERSGGKVVFNFAASSTLARQILEGARADLFLSADEAQMNRLAAASMILESTRRSFLSNTLAVVVPSDRPVSSLPLKRLSTVRRLALADPEMVPAGVYAKACLSRLGWWEAIAPRVIPAENVRAALAMVEAGNADAGIVYRTDATRSRKVQIAFEIAEADGPRIAYPVAVCRGTRNAAQARAFLQFLESPEGLRIFRQFGFLTPQARPAQ